MPGTYLALTQSKAQALSLRGFWRAFPEGLTLLLCLGMGGGLETRRLGTRAKPVRGKDATYSWVTPASGCPEKEGETGEGRSEKEVPASLWKAPYSSVRKMGFITSENILWVYVDNLQDPSLKIKILSRNAICKREDRRGQVCSQDSATPSTPSHTHTMVGVKWTGFGLRTKSDPSSHLLFSGPWCLLWKCLLWVVMETFKVPEL